MQRFLRPFSFSLMGVIILLLIAGSAVEQIYGTAVAIRYVYAAPWTIVLWALAAISGMVYLVSCFKSRLNASLFTFLLHFSFVVILGGAMVTHLWGEQGDIHLRLNEPKPLGNDLSVLLKDFHIEFYPNSMAPADFVSEIAVTHDGQTASGEVSMNSIFSFHHYRFYQSQYDGDGKGVTLRYSHDPWGIGFTYAGYSLLLLSMVGFFFQRRTRFRALLKQLSVAVLVSLPLAANAAPPSVPVSVAAEWGNLYVYYNDRICPMQTLATDFTTKIYGKPTYEDLDANQVLCGWLFYYDQWAKEPCIKIKGTDVREILGIEGKYACLNDYVGDRQYKLAAAIRQGNKNARAADEKIQLISQVCTGRMLPIYPVANEDSTASLTWYSWSDKMPSNISFENFQFIKRSMDYVALCVAQHAWPEAQDALTKIKAWQTERYEGNAFRFNAEKVYTSFHYTRPLAMACATFGLLLFVLTCVFVSRNRSLPRGVETGVVIFIACVWLILTVGLVLRWIVSAHVPMSNGFETMQFMAWASALLTLLFAFSRLSSTRSSREGMGLGFVLASGLLVTGMTLMVSMMSSANPRITHLMPVLQSPLLTMHVAVIMIAYCLLAFIMLNGVAALCVPSIRLRMQTISQILLYPAVFCLTIGIFLGAVWANISWGRYWGWDPKEVWALITMLVYSGLLHWRPTRSSAPDGTNSVVSNPRSVVYFHIYAVVAFLFVLFTYFGVNFLLGGLHSYANS